jgi:hypothetical protein
VKAAQPCVKAAVIGIDILYVDGATRVPGHAHTGAQVDERLGDAGLPGKAVVTGPFPVTKSQVLPLRSRVTRMSTLTTEALQAIGCAVSV